MTETKLPTLKAGSPLNADARARMEALNADAAHLSIWLRTQANAPAQHAWFSEPDLHGAGALAQGRVAAGQMKAIPHHWKWSEISPYLDKIARIASEAEIPPVEFADRQQFLLTILSRQGGYTVVEGERCEAARGDIILTPNGTWHDHGNDAQEPVVWIDTLDWPLLEFLDIIWLDEDLPAANSRENLRAQKTVHESGYSRRLYGSGGMVPKFVSHQRGIGHNLSPYVHFYGADILSTLQAMRAHAGDAYEGINIDLVNPVTGASLFPTLGYGAQLLRAGEETLAKRETSSTVYVCMQGRGQTEVAGHTFQWEENDIFVVPNFLWRRHVADSSGDAILYSMSDAPLLEKIGQYRAQGIDRAGKLQQIVA